MDNFMNAVRGEAERVAQRITTHRIGIVSSYDPDSYAVKVKLQPEDIETGWAPVASPMVGNGWGIFMPPSPGDQVVVAFQEGNVETPMVMGSLYNLEDRPVLEDLKGTPSGELRLVHKSGARIRFAKDDGTIEIRQKDKVQVVIKPDGTIQVTGNTVEVTADKIQIGAEGSAFLRLVNETFRTLFNTHVHGTGPVPAQQMTDAHLTSHTKAS